MVRSALKRKIVFFKEVPRISGLNLLKLVVDLRIAVRISVNEAAVDRERPRENRRSSQCCEMIDPGFADSTLNSGTRGKKRAVLGDVGNSAGSRSLIGGGN